jgi:hypothetical protein
LFGVPMAHWQACIWLQLESRVDTEGEQALHFCWHIRYLFVHSVGACTEGFARDVLDESSSMLQESWREIFQRRAAA